MECISIWKKDLRESSICRMISRTIFRIWICILCLWFTRRSCETSPSSNRRRWRYFFSKEWWMLDDESLLLLLRNWSCVFLWILHALLPSFSLDTRNIDERLCWCRCFWSQTKRSAVYESRASCFSLLIFTPSALGVRSIQRCRCWYLHEMLNAFVWIWKAHENHLQSFKWHALLKRVLRI